MARHKHFDPDRALDGALMLFWSRGYQAASLPELLDATALSRSSLYETFGTKRELLLAALERYVAQGMCGLAAPLFASGAGRAAIEQTFSNMVSHALTPEGQRGCLVNNCTTEVAPHDETVRVAVQRARRELERALLRAVRRGQAEGEITTARSATALARFLANNLSGLNVMAKLRPGRAALEDVVQVTLGVLQPIPGKVSS